MISVLFSTLAKRVSEAAPGHLSTRARHCAEHGPCTYWPTEHRIIISTLSSTEIPLGRSRATGKLETRRTRVRTRKKTRESAEPRAWVHKSARSVRAARR